MVWRVGGGYIQSSSVKTQIGHRKGLVESKLNARSFPSRKTEVQISAGIFNKMTKLGRPWFKIIR